MERGFGCEVVTPRFTEAEASRGMTDFRDLARSCGKEWVRAALDPDIRRLEREDRERQERRAEQVRQERETAEKELRMVEGEETKRAGENVSSPALGDAAKAERDARITKEFEKMDPAALDEALQIRECLQIFSQLAAYRDAFLDNALGQTGAALFPSGAVPVEFVRRSFQFLFGLAPGEQADGYHAPPMFDRLPGDADSGQVIDLGNSRFEDALFEGLPAAQARRRHPQALAQVVELPILVRPLTSGVERGKLVEPGRILAFHGEHGAGADRGPVMGVPDHGAEGGREPPKDFAARGINRPVHVGEDDAREAALAAPSVHRE